MGKSISGDPNFKRLTALSLKPKRRSRILEKVLEPHASRIILGRPL